MKMKGKKNTTVAELFQNSKNKRRKRENDRAYSWLDTRDCIKSCGTKLILCAQINIFYKFNLEL